MRLILGTLSMRDGTLTEKQQAQIREASFSHGATFTFTNNKFDQWYQEAIYDVGALPMEVIERVSVTQAIALPGREIEPIPMPQMRPTTVVNNRVNVAVPGIGLMSMVEAMVEYDLCTDMLNTRLREGWRILAICPQPDQRRPDYILGKPKQQDDDDEQVRW